MLLAFREEVESALAEALAGLELPAGDLAVEHPPADVDAVLASSVAYRVASDAGMAPQAVAADIAETIDERDWVYVAEVVATDAYVNFRPSANFFDETLTAARRSEYGRLDSTGESIVVEHTSANPSGPVHVGRARNSILGDALGRILDFAGNDVERHYYVNDAGRQMALFAWAYDRFDEPDLPPPEREKPDHELVRYYRRGNEFLDTATDDETATAEAAIEDLIRRMDAGEAEAIDRVWNVVGRVLDGMRSTLTRFGVEFDEFVRETRFLRDGSTQAIVDRLKDSDHATREDGAWQLTLEEWGIDKPFVFLRSDGTTLYTTRDIAHHEWKFDRFDRAITVLGEDQQMHAQQLTAALETLGNDTDHLEELFHGWVTLPGDEGMSTRAGTGVDLDDLLDEAVARARTEVEDRLDERARGELDDAAIERIARQVGIGAVRYDIVAKQPTKAITFEWDRALDFEAQSAPYVQYVHARACGILERASSTPEPAAVDARPLDATSERTLLETLARFPAIVDEAADERRPHRVATYTRDLAESFNAFYRECPVLDAEPPTRDARLAVVDATRTTVHNALWLLGIDAPERM